MLLFSPPCHLFPLNGNDALGTNLNFSKKYLAKKTIFCLKNNKFRKRYLLSAGLNSTVLNYPSSAFNKTLAYKSNALFPAIPLCRVTLSPFPSWTSMPGRRATTDTTPHTTQSTMPHTTPHTTQHPHHTTTRPHTHMPQSPRPQPHPTMW